MKMAGLLPLFLLLQLFALNSYAGEGRGDFLGGFDDNTKYILIRLHRLGLANRLRAIADWYQIAVSSHRHLLVSWLPTYDCNATFIELFVDGPDGIIYYRPDIVSLSHIAIYANYS